MSDKQDFMELKKAQLVEAAEFFQVDAEGTKEDITEELIANGVTFELYQENAESVHANVEAEEPDEETTEDSEELALVYMQGRNRRFEAYGYTFTREHPFVPVPKALAEQLVTDESYSRRFRLASWEEAERYYE